MDTFKVEATGVQARQGRGTIREQQESTSTTAIGFYGLFFDPYAPAVNSVDNGRCFANRMAFPSLRAPLRFLR